MYLDTRLRRSPSSRCSSVCTRDTVSRSGDLCGNFFSSHTNCAMNASGDIPFTVHGGRLFVANPDAVACHGITYM